jgi:hypothetical protein
MITPGADGERRHENAFAARSSRTDAALRGPTAERLTDSRIERMK